MSRATRTIASPNQIPLITPKSDWRPPTWAELEAIDLNRYARVGFDTETRDPDLLEKGSCWATPSRGGHVAGVSLSLEGDRSLYIPLAHPEDNVEDPEKAARWVAEQLTSFRGELVGLNLLYDLGWLTRLTQKRVQSTLIDVGYVEALVDENRSSYSLQAIARSYNVGLKNEAMLKEAAAAYGLDPKADLWRMPARFVGEYAEDDAALLGGHAADVLRLVHGSPFYALRWRRKFSSRSMAGRESGSAFASMFSRMRVASVVPSEEGAGAAAANFTGARPGTGMERIVAIPFSSFPMASRNDSAPPISAWSVSTAFVSASSFA